MYTRVSSGLHKDKVVKIYPKSKHLIAMACRTVFY